VSTPCDSDVFDFLTPNFIVVNINGDVATMGGARRQPLCGLPIGIVESQEEKKLGGGRYDILEWTTSRIFYVDAGEAVKLLISG